MAPAHRFVLDREKANADMDTNTVIAILGLPAVYKAGQVAANVSEDFLKKVFGSFTAILLPRVGDADFHSRLARRPDTFTEKLSGLEFPWPTGPMFHWDFLKPAAESNVPA